jgi:tetratricopeptide (TPR) repeat protein
MKKLTRNLAMLKNQNNNAKAIEIRPTYTAAHKQLGDVYQSMNENTKAIEACKKCVQYDLTNESANYNLGFLNNASQFFTEAIVWLKKVNANIMYNDLLQLDKALADKLHTEINAL